MAKFRVHFNIYRAEKTFAPKNSFASKGLHHKVSVEVDGNYFDDAEEIATAKVKNLFRYSDKYDTPKFFVSLIELL